MAEKKTVLHIIDSLGRGGAETLLVGTIKSTPELEHIIISLKPLNEFQDELADIKIHFIALNWYHSIPKVVYQVKQIISKYQINIIHAHLYWSVIVSRLACPLRIKLINSYHAILYGNAKYPFYALLLDKFTYTDKVTTLCVSEEVKKNVQKHVGIKKKIFILHNFIDDSFYENFHPLQQFTNTLKMVAVGNIKKDKNYEAIINAFTRLNSIDAERISLDIYGKGPLHDELENKCQYKGIVNIHFKGAIKNIGSVLPKYDAYIISSISEGFGLAVVEAMAVGLPVIVSDIPTLREITGGHALFFNPLFAPDLTDKIKAVLDGNIDLQALAMRGHEYAKNYTKKAYLERLLYFYLN